MCNIMNLSKDSGLAKEIKNNVFRKRTRLSHRQTLIRSYSYCSMIGKPIQQREQLHIEKFKKRESHTNSKTSYLILQGVYILLGLLKKAPAATFLGTFTLATSRLTFSFAALELSQALHLVEDELQELLSSNNFEMAANAWILLGELLNVGFREVSAESQVEFAGEVVVEFRKEFDIQEQYCR